MSPAGRAGAEVAADRAGVADLRRADGAGRLGQGRERAGRAVALEHLGVGEAGAERPTSSPSRSSPALQLRHPAKADDRRRAAVAEVDLDHEVGAAGEQMCVGPGVERVERVRQAGGSGDGGHGLPPGRAVSNVPAPECGHGSDRGLLVTGAELVATVDDERREIAGGWVAITGGRGQRRRRAGRPAAGGDDDAATRRLPGHRRGWSTPTTTSTRTSPARTARRCAAACSTGSPRSTRCGRRLDEEAAYLSAWVGLAELALGGCTTIDRPPLRPPRAAAAT